MQLLVWLGCHRFPYDIHPMVPSTLKQNFSNVPRNLVFWKVEISTSSPKHAKTGVFWVVFRKCVLFYRTSACLAINARNTLNLMRCCWKHACSHLKT